MAEIINEEMFRPAKKNGFDREDVLNKVQAIKEAAVIEKNAIQEKLDAALKENAELKEKSAALQDEVDKLKKDISEKYQSYIDNYDMIGSLIYDAKVQSRNIISDAEAEKELARLIGGAVITENTLKSAREMKFLCREFKEHEL